MVDGMGHFLGALMKHKTSDLTGEKLNMAVHRALEASGQEVMTAGFPGLIAYSTSWSLAGPIIERERIGIEWDHYNCFGMGWGSVLEHDARPDGVQRSFGRGDTPLIAADGPGSPGAERPAWGSCRSTATLCGLPRTPNQEG